MGSFYLACIHLFKLRSVLLFEVFNVVYSYTMKTWKEIYRQGETEWQLQNWITENKSNTEVAETFKSKDTPGMWTIEYSCVQWRDLVWSALNSAFVSEKWNNLREFFFLVTVVTGNMTSWRYEFSFLYRTEILWSTVLYRTKHFGH